VGTAKASYGLPATCHDEDDATTPCHHVRGKGCRDHVVGGYRLDNGAHEIFEGHLDQRRPLNVVTRGRVEADVDTATRGSDANCVALDRYSIENIELGDVRCPALAPDALRDLLERRLGAAGEMNFGALASVRSCDSGADCSSGAVHDRDLLLEQHVRVLRSGLIEARLWAVGGAAG
jgi:hypothetical protein